MLGPVSSVLVVVAFPTEQICGGLSSVHLEQTEADSPRTKVHLAVARTHVPLPFKPPAVFFPPSLSGTSSSSLFPLSPSSLFDPLPVFGRSRVIFTGPLRFTGFRLAVAATWAGFAVFEAVGPAAGFVVAGVFAGGRDGPDSFSESDPESEL